MQTRSLFASPLIFVLSGLLTGIPFAKVLAQTTIPAPSNSANFHHVHLNVTHPDSTITYYRKFFGAVVVNYRDKKRALFTERSFILFDSVAQGISVQTPLTPLVPNLSKPTDTNYYMYFFGPSHELIEVYNGNRNHRFEHMHPLSSNIEATTNWFISNLGFTPRYAKPVNFYGVLMNIFQVGNVNLIIFAKPTPDTDNYLLTKEVWPMEGFKATDGTAIDHTAFAYPSNEPVFKRMKSAGVEIVSPVKTDPAYGLSSFFVRGPDHQLIEIVKEKPIPEGIWLP